MVRLHSKHKETNEGARQKGKKREWGRGAEKQARKQVEESVQDGRTKRKKTAVATESTGVGGCVLRGRGREEAQDWKIRGLSSEAAKVSEG